MSRTYFSSLTKSICRVHKTRHMTAYTEPLRYFLRNPRQERCIGSRQHSHEGCRTHISQESRQKAGELAQNLLQEYERGKLDTCQAHLNQFAVYLLCKRNHQSQAESITAHWVAALNGMTTAAEISCPVSTTTPRTKSRRRNAQVDAPSVIGRRPWTRSMGTPLVAHKYSLRTKLPRGCHLTDTIPEDGCAICMSDVAAEWVSYRCCKKVIHFGCAQEWDQFGKTCPFW